MLRFLFTIFDEYRSLFEIIRNVNIGPSLMDRLSVRPLYSYPAINLTTEELNDQ